MTKTFEEKRSLLKEKLSQIKNRKLLEKLFKKEATIDEQISNIDKILKIDNIFNDINNDNLKERLLEKINKIPNDKVEDFIINNNKVYKTYISNSKKIAS